MYRISFQIPFIASTDAFYKAESESFIGTNLVTEYMKKAQAWLASEDKRLENYLHESSREELIRTSEVVLIKAHSSLMQDQFQTLLERDKIEDLSRMYSLLSRVPDTLVKLRDLFEGHVRDMGLAAVKKAVAAASEGNSGASIPADEEEEGTKKQTRKVAYLI